MPLLRPDSRAPEPLTPDRAAQLFRALAHPLRIELIMMLLALSEVTVLDASAELEQSPSQITKHLRVLVNAGLVTVSRAQKYHPYGLARPDIAQFVAVQLGQADAGAPFMQPQTRHK